MISRKDVEPEEECKVLATAAERGHVVHDVASPWIHPFWRVERVTAQDDARINMAIQKKVANNGCKLPCLVNTRKVASGEPLVWLIDPANKHNSSSSAAKATAVAKAAVDKAKAPKAAQKKTAK